MLDFFSFLAVGRLVIWFVQINGLFQLLKRYRIIEDLLTCDLCLGFWVYLGLGAFWPVSWFPGLNIYLGAPITALISAFLAHLLRLGWQYKFGEL